METKTKKTNKARVYALKYLGFGYILRNKLRAALADRDRHKQDAAYLRDLLRIKEKEHAGKMLLLEARMEDYNAGFPLSDVMAVTPISILSAVGTAAENSAKALELINKLAYIIGETKETAADGLAFMREVYGR